MGSLDELIDVWFVCMLCQEIIVVTDHHFSFLVGIFATCPLCGYQHFIFDPFYKNEMTVVDLATPPFEHH